MLRDEWTNDTKKPSPETCDTACSTSDWRWEGFRCPSVQYRIEHGLEKVLHDVEAYVGRRRVDAAEEEDGNTHESRGDNHSPLAAHS